MNGTTFHPAWRAAGSAIVTSYLVLGLLFAGTLWSLGELWSESDSYGHGIFVVPISLYALWLLRPQLMASAPRPWPLAVFGVVGCSLGWALARAVGIEVGEQLAVVGMLFCLTVTVLGPRVTWLVGFPLVYLLLAIPVWDLLVPVLQEHTATVSAEALRAFGVPVYLEGFYITIPSGSFEIAEVCAGLRYFMAMASIGAFYAFLNQLTLAAGLGFFFLSLGWAILFNWVRVTGIIAVGHATEMQHSLVHDHYTYGWILFAVALLPLLYAGRWFKLAPIEEPVQEPADAKAAPYVVFAFTFVAVLGMTAGPAVLGALTERQFAGPFELEWGNASESGWQRIDSVETPVDWAPSFPGAAWSQAVEYSDELGNRAMAFAAVYGRETQGAELVNATNAPYDRDRWSPIRSSAASGVPAELGGAAREVIVKDKLGNVRVIWYIYRANEQFSTSDLRTKINQVRALLSGQPAGAVLAFAVTGALELSTARELLARLSGALVVGMTERLRAAGIP